MTEREEMSELTPITRKETFLAKAGGQDVVTPEPITRTEQFLQAIIDNGGGGGGGGTGGGVLVVGVDMQTMSLDKTWKEINDAPFAVVHLPNSQYELSFAFVYMTAKNPITGEGTVLIANGSAESEAITFYNLVFIAATEDDYPVLNMG